MRGKKAPRRTIDPDLKYNSVTVSRFINKIIVRGQKETARKNVYKAFDVLKDKTGKEPLGIFETALKNAAPVLEVNARRIGGATYQVPMEVRPERRETLAMRWIITAARAGKGGNFSDFLANEILDAYNNTGTAMKKKEVLHKMAEANKAFAHFARF
ncbi:TPA: 30S ribosomal protein S7 [Candidatus Berkelbacteria bacterium]|uniref:Small ribosomal subunit protein uS7 n=1 Tax=Berkelbacteria bacterium GW2011_GWE1_39_12 TaxID=1618337 RepID=A0A0G4B5H0_9BACT|nr:MAG: 30S ribosomal protein S7, small subunit ribosomal protein S7 [Berkelbacteria bacterium GW2011_GWE1_39_12]HBO60235.1 30S ribosomal protein S7 [Candidatus Berkelbacteria bacterium]